MNYEKSSSQDFLEFGNNFQGAVQDIQNELRLGFIRKVF